MSSSEIIRCKECGQVFDTIESLKEHEKSEKEDQELQNKRLWSGALMVSGGLNSGLKINIVCFSIVLSKSSILLSIIGNIRLELPLLLSKLQKLLIST